MKETSRLTRFILGSWEQNVQSTVPFDTPTGLAIDLVQKYN